MRKLIRNFFDEGKAYPILFGPLKGKKLQYDPSVSLRRLFGLTEGYQLRTIHKVLQACGILKPDAIFCDAGANVGLYTLYLSQLIHDIGKVHSFEPAPKTAASLRANLALNNVQNVEVIERALADKIGHVEFIEHDNHNTSGIPSVTCPLPGRISQIASTTLDDYFLGTSTREAPDFIMMDIEGSGVFALTRCDGCFEKKRPILSVESHIPEEDRTIGELLNRFDYRAFRLNDRRWVKDLSATHPNPDGVWGHLIAYGSEHHSRLEKLLA